MSYVAEAALAVALDGWSQRGKPSFAKPNWIAFAFLGGVNDS